MNENAGPYAGLDRFEARRVLDDLQAGGFLVGTKDYVLPLGKCDRCKTIVEPRLSTQWFVKISRWPTAPLRSSRRARSSLSRRTTRRSTSNGCATFTTGASRASCGGDIAFPRGIAKPAAKSLWRAKRRSSASAAARSSRTPTCSTPGSPRAAAVLGSGLARKDARSRHVLSHALLITGFDILFFWVARMIMMDCHFMRGNPTRRRALSQSLHTRTGARCRAPEDVEDQGQRDRSHRGHREVRHRRRALHAGIDGGSGRPTSPFPRAAPRAIAPLPTRSGMPRASCS